MQSFALWLVGLGGCLLFLGVVSGSPRPRLHLLLEGRDDKRRDRVTLALNAAGLGCGATGSIMLVLSAMPDPTAAAGSFLAVVAVLYVALVVRLRQLWSERLREAEAGLLVAQHSARAQWELEAARLCR